jgi:signal transduction histidine kinase
MRITYKLTLLHILALAVVLASYGWFSVQREIDLIEADKQHDTRAYGRCLAELVREVFVDHGDRRAVELLSRVDLASDAIDVRWQWFGPEGSDGPETAHDEQILGDLRQRRMAVRIDHEVPGGLLTTYVPVIVEGERIGVVALEESLDDEISYVRGSVQRVALTMGIAAVLLGALAALVGGRLGSRPMQELVILAQRVAQGDLTRRMVRKQRDEVGDLAREMNLMCDRLMATREELQQETAARIEALQNLRQNDRLATVGRIAAGLAHELGTPLSVIQGHADLIAEGGSSPEQLGESASVIARVTRRMATAIRQMLDFARRRETEKDSYELFRLVRRSLALLQDLARRAGVAIETRGDIVMVEVDGAQMEQVVTNLALNAIHAMPEGGLLEVSVGVQQIEPPPEHQGPRPSQVACIEVKDQGDGIRPEHLPVLFEPFFTTKPVGQGTGLGLPIARAIVEEHGGWLDVHTEVGSGSRFRVCLPLEDPPA